MHNTNKNRYAILREKILIGWGNEQEKEHYLLQLYYSNT